MEVHIGDVDSRVRAVDGDALLAPQTIDRIVRIVLQAVNDQDEHRKRAQSERRITSGVRDELSRMG